MGRKKIKLPPVNSLLNMYEEYTQKHMTKTDMKWYNRKRRYKHQFLYLSGGYLPITWCVDTKNPNWRDRLLSQEKIDELRETKPF